MSVAEKEIAKLEASVSRLLRYIEEEHYAGYDPYDALKSPIFRLPVLRDNKLIRFTSQQLVKRSPVNVRAMLRIPMGLNPVTLGLCIQGYSNLMTVFPDHAEEYARKIETLLKVLIRLIPQDRKGACWGYDFDWEARYASIPAYQPSVVATGFITNALFNAYLSTQNDDLLKPCISSTAFVLNDINRTYEGENFCFSYSPFDKQIVFNASMKGARILAQAYSVTGGEALKKAARCAVAYVMAHQLENGAWVYSKSKTGTWIDNYHTGYIIDCLDEYIKYTGDKEYRRNLTNGFTFYRNHFFEKEMIPKFYDRKTYPVDCTAAAQSLLTLTKFRETRLAMRVASWLIDHMQDENGFFYYRKFANRTVKTSFMRWSNAWMFLGLSALLREIHS